MRRFPLVVAMLSCVALIIACVTVNIYFPAAEIQRAADEIVEEVRPEQEGDQGSFLQRIRFQWLAELAVSFLFSGPDVAAAQVDVDISSPGIRKLKASIAQRFESLKPYYNQGALGENNNGYVEIRDESGLNLKEKANLRQLVEAENTDRKALYREILVANNLDTQFLSEVEKLFANSWRSKALTGSWIQKDDGTWVKK